eukprot:Pgem_evm1s1660
MLLLEQERTQNLFRCQIRAQLQEHEEQRKQLIEQQQQEQIRQTLRLKQAHMQQQQIFINQMQATQFHALPPQAPQQLLPNQIQPQIPTQIQPQLPQQLTLSQGPIALPSMLDPQINSLPIPHSPITKQSINAISSILIHPQAITSQSLMVTPVIPPHTVQAPIIQQPIEAAQTQQAITQSKAQAHQAQVQAEIHQAQVQAEIHQARVQAEIHQAQVQAEIHQAQVQAEIHQAQVQAEIHQAQVQAEIHQAQAQAQVQVHVQATQTAQEMCRSPSPTTSQLQSMVKQELVKHEFVQSQQAQVNQVTQKMCRSPSPTPTQLQSMDLVNHELAQQESFKQEIVQQEFIKQVALEARPQTLSPEILSPVELGTPPLAFLSPTLQGETNTNTNTNNNNVSISIPLIGIEKLALVDNKIKRENSGEFVGPTICSEMEAVTDVDHVKKVAEEQNSLKTDVVMDDVPKDEETPPLKKTRRASLKDRSEQTIVAVNSKTIQKKRKKSSLGSIDSVDLNKGSNFIEESDPTTTTTIHTTTAANDNKKGKTKNKSKNKKSKSNNKNDMNKKVVEEKLAAQEEEFEDSSSSSPSTDQEKNIKRKTKGKGVENSTGICSHCGLTQTSLWRHGKDGKIVCNACGCYEKKHHVPRPLALIQRRKVGIPYTRNRRKSLDCSKDKAATEKKNEKNSKSVRRAESST